MRAWALVCLAGARAAGAGSVDADGYMPVDMDAPMQKGEMDALMQTAGSDRLKGMEVTGRKTAADGKSGMLQFSNPNSEKQSWSPQHVVSHRELLKKVEDEALVLAYFFSSEQDEIATSHSHGKEFEQAASTLLESDDVVSCVMVDYHRMDPRDAAADFGVSEAHEWVLFMGSKPTKYKGPTDAKGIVSYMTARAGPSVRKLATADALDAALEDASAASATVVVGCFLASYEGNAAKNAFHTKAMEMRDPDRVRFVETSFRTANAAKRLAEHAPFDGYASAFAVLPPSAFVPKTTRSYALSTDFRKVFTFVQAHAFPTIFSNTPAFRAHVSAHHHKDLLAVILYSHAAHGAKQRYIIKQLHKLLESDAALADTYALALGERKPLDPWVAERFERTTLPGYEADGKPKFFADFARDYPMTDFTVVVANMSSGENWLDASTAGATPEGFDALRLAPFLRRIASFSARPLPQKEAAAPAAGLREMQLGFDENGQAKQTMGGPRKLKNPNKKKKKKKQQAKDEV